MAKRIITVPLSVLGMIWASPYTVLGLLIGMIGLCTGGRGRIRGSLVLWLMGRRPYRDNPFERQAYEQEGEGDRP